jgi:hypothetical protein
MKPSKEHLKILASQSLIKAGINWTEYNNGLHYKIGNIDFYPTTGKWIRNYKGTKDDIFGQGVETLIGMILSERKPYPNVKGSYPLTVQQIAKIFLKNEGKSLMEKCEILHKEIYR